MTKIKDIDCHKIVNSRGDWTIQTRVVLEDGSVGIQTIPDGASKGKKEAVYVTPEKSVELVTHVIKEAITGIDAFDQGKIDRTLVEIDGTENKKHLGANSILSVSLASSKAAAQSKNIPLYKYLAELYKNTEKLVIPTPVFNILNGGKHASNDLSFQEFMVIPAKKLPFDEQYEMGVNIYHTLEKNLEKAGQDVGVGDEGGFAPNGLNPKTALEFIKDSASEKYKVGTDVFLGMDVAADSFKDVMNYFIEEEGLHLSTDGLVDYYRELLKHNPIIYLEDPFYEEDFDGWKKIYKEFASNLMVVADDLTVTNPLILEELLPMKLHNAVIVKPNQVGSLTETFEFIRIAKENNMMITVSHRSGDTAEDTFIADLAVAVGADFIKSGAPARGERVAKYNRLMEIFLDLKEIT
ncbi:phosphopyruvate hydratase [candidate division WWE3 bacterium]|nr:phosphopyruvate hydratase [candidate division WWE3 bacterium]MBT7349435.1 phosphopyruvate hydratase [candidate division WWE3 bacterium]